MKRPAHLAPLPPAAEPAIDLHRLVDEAFAADGPFARSFPGYQPRPGQIEFAHAVTDGILDQVCVLAEAGTGCHVAGQGILLYDGTVKKVEDVIVGDQLMGPDGSPRHVLNLARGEDEIARVVPVKGEPWEVNFDHVLTLVRTNCGTRGEKVRRDCKDGEIVDVRVRDWMTWAKTKKHVYKLFRQGCDFDQPLRKFTLESYHLGILLGDGCMKYDSISVCKVDPEIEEECKKLAERFNVRLRTKREDRRATHFFSSFRGRNLLITEMRTLGLMGCGSADKFIPNKYRTASRAQRLELLAGLVDTDGSLTNGGIEYVTKSIQLAKDVLFVARSLGFAAYLKETRKRWQNGIDTYQRIFISGDCSILPLRLKRKLSPLRLQKKNVLRTGFRIERAGRRDAYYGFTLSGDGRYLLDDFTVTHNTGKSFGALVPAALAITSSHRGKAIYVTANIALQEQIIRKDLPTLRKVLGLNFDFALAKGFSNYLCQAALIENKTKIDDGKTRLPVASDARDFQKIFDWRTNTGDFSDLDFEPSAYVKSLVSMGSDECYGKTCQYWLSDCYPRKARKAFQNASIVVTNYHLYFLDLEMKRRGAPGILPEHRILILDEFHAAAEIARSYLGEKISEGSIKTAAETLDARGPRAEKLDLPRGLDPILQAEVLAAAKDFFKELLELGTNPKLYKARINKSGMIDGGQLETKLRAMEDKYVRAAETPELKAEARDWLRSRANLAARQAGVIAGAREFEDDEQIFYIDVQQPRGSRGSPLFGMKRAALVREPLYPAETLRAELFEKNEQPRAIVGCSATLTTSSSKPFAFIARQVGLNRFDECVAESPFDFSRAAFVVPKGLSDPKAESFAREVAQQFHKLTDITGGRALGLFTSYRVLDVVAETMSNSKFQVLVQGRAPRMQLIKQFKEDETSVLLGTESFWTGVDVPGDSLVAVFIDKIPFDHFDDPVLDAVKEHDKNWFKSYYLPKAVIAFKQGFGRLIRSVEDRGVVVCCDSRITGTPYGRSFLKSLPPDVQVYNSLEVVARYVEKR